MSNPIQTVIVVGCDTIAWLVAAALKKNIANIEVYLLEDGAEGSECLSSSELFGACYSLLGVSATQLLANTDATFSLGSDYTFSTTPNAGFMHSFSGYGDIYDVVEFSQYAAMLKRSGVLEKLEDYSLGATAANRGKFSSKVSDPAGGSVALQHGVNVSYDLLANSLSLYARRLGVHCQKNKIVSAEETAQGTINCLLLEDGRQLSGDFFIDCSGSDAKLIGGLKKVENYSWKDYLPFSSRAQLKFPQMFDQRPMTCVDLLSGGWIKRTFLRSGTFCQIGALDDHLLERLVNQTPIFSGAEKLAVQSAGCRSRFWMNNCLAIGGSACNPDNFSVSEVEVSLAALAQLIKLWPDKNFSHAKINEYNRVMTEIYQSIRDFHGLHYHLVAVHNSRGTPLFPVGISEDLQRDIDLFAITGRLSARDQRWVPATQWISLMLGMNFWPSPSIPIVKYMSEKSYINFLADIKRRILWQVEQMPTHAESVKRTFVDAASGQ